MRKKFIYALSGAILLSGAAPFAQASNVDWIQKSESAAAATSPAVKVPVKPSGGGGEELEKAMAGAKISKETAVEIAGAFYKIPSGYKRDAVDFQTNWYPNERSVWNVRWSKQEDRMNGNISITVDAQTGNVLAMNWYENDPDRQAAYPPKVDWEQARTAAEQFIAEHFPGITGQLRYNEDAEKNSRLPLKGIMNYYVKFDRVVGGIPFYDNYIVVNVDGDGKVFSLDYLWDGTLKFADASGMMDEKQAADKLKSSLQMELRYQTQYFYRPYVKNAEDSRQIVLTYQPVNPLSYIDAKTGQWISDQGTAVKPQPGTRKPVSDRPLGPPPKARDKELTQQEALNIVTDTFKLPSDVKSTQASYNEKWGESKESVWNFNWSRQNGDYWAYAAVNARTGEIINFSEENPKRYATPDNDFKAVVSAEQAEKTALEYLKKLYPSKVNQVYLAEKNGETQKPANKLREYAFTFNRLVNGIPVQDQQISISIAADTGKLIRVYMNWNDSLPFPKPQNVISAEQAKEVYLKGAELKLHYFMPYGNPVPLPLMNSKDGGKITAEAIPVYSLRLFNYQEPVYLDAVKGAWVSLQSGEAVKEPVEPTDISGNWAEKELRLMIDYRAIEVGDDGKVYPDKTMTRGELVKMLIYATVPDPVYIEKMSYDLANKEASFSDVSPKSKYFNVVELAVQQGLLDKSQKQLKPEEEVTRAELAALIVKAMRMDKLAKVDGLFHLDVNDADKIANKGEVALVTKLGIIPAEDGSFHPDGKVSRAQAAYSFYRFLEKRAELTTNTPIYY